MLNFSVRATRQKRAKPKNPAQKKNVITTKEQRPLYPSWKKLI
jgi:hypothetical protein